MNEQWLQTYILLAFRIDKAIRAFSTNSPFVDCYYGPPEWKDIVATEGVAPAGVNPNTVMESVQLFW